MAYHVVGYALQSRAKPLYYAFLTVCPMDGGLAEVCSRGVRCLLMNNNDCLTQALRLIRFA